MTSYACSFTNSGSGSGNRFKCPGLMVDVGPGANSYDPVWVVPAGKRMVLKCIFDMIPLGNSSVVYAFRNTEDEPAEAGTTSQMKTHILVAGQSLTFSSATSSNGFTATGFVEDDI